LNVTYDIHRKKVGRIYKEDMSMDTKVGHEEGATIAGKCSPTFQRECAHAS